MTWCLHTSDPECPQLRNISNGKVEVNGYVEESVAIYECNKGYQLLGVCIRICYENSTWSGTEPICESKYDANKVINTVLELKLK